MSIVERLKQVLHLKLNRELSIRLGVTASNISDASRSGKVPEAWLYKVAYETQCRVEWLKTGRGPIYLDEAIAEARTLYGKEALESTGELIKHWKTLNEDSRRIAERCVEALHYNEDRAMLASIADTVLKKHEHDKAKETAASNKKKR